MIDWSFMFSVTFGVICGSEFRRYMLAKKGVRESLLPVWQERLLIVAAALSLAFAYEFARIALESPTRSHVWHLIFAAGVAAIFMAVHLGRELSLTRKELHRLQSQMPGKSQ